MVGVAGFEPAASWTRTMRDTKLRHTPKCHIIIIITAANVKPEIHRNLPRVGKSRFSDDTAALRNDRPIWQRGLHIFVKPTFLRYTNPC